MKDRKNYFDIVKEARLPKDNILSRGGVRSDADEEGEWITVKGTHIHLNEEGVPDKGPKKIIASMKDKREKNSKKPSTKTKREFPTELDEQDFQTLKKIHKEELRERPYMYRGNESEPFDGDMEIQMMRTAMHCTYEVAKDYGRGYKTLETLNANEAMKRLGGREKWLRGIYRCARNGHADIDLHDGTFIAFGCKIRSLE